MGRVDPALKKTREAEIIVVCMYLALFVKILKALLANQALVFTQEDSD
jgi:hypothetical protein